MHRRETTRWLPKEIKAFKLLLPIEESDLASMERYYRKNWPPRHNKNCLRTDLYTLLNNWMPELDRANAYNEAHSVKPPPRKIIPLPLTGKPEPEPIRTPEDLERIARFEEELDRRRPGRKSPFQKMKAIMKEESA